MGSTPGKYQSPFQALAMKNVDRASASPAQATVPTPTPMPFTPPDSGAGQPPIAPAPVDNSGGYQNILKRLFAPGNRGAY